MKGCRREPSGRVRVGPGAYCERPIANVTSISARTVVGKFGRKWPSVALSVSMAALAAFVLWHLLHNIDVGKVVAALEAQPIRKIVIAGLFAVGGYITLTFYDVFALRTIGQQAIPFRIAALASFTSYTIGHSLGAATLTGGLVRFRVYSATRRRRQASSTACRPLSTG
jgi:uncharacterized membrane protein YbhN (UPF0104 family)